MKNKIFRFTIILLISVSIVISVFKLYCDKTFLCSTETLTVTIPEGVIDAHNRALNERSYTYCRFLGMKTKIQNTEYDLFLECFENYYINHCSDDSRYAAFRSVFCDYEKLTDEEIDVLLEALNRVYNYDIQNNILERNHLIQYNLSLQAEILYSSGHVIKAFQKKELLNEYIKEYKKEAEAEYLK